MLYRILNTERVQSLLRERKAKEDKKSIASIVRRTASREKLLAKIEKTVEARGEAYAELIPGGEHGLVVHSDRKSSMVGKDEDGPILVHFDVYKTDGAMMEAWDRVLNSQEKADAALLKNMRSEEREDQEAEMREQTGKIRDLERQRLELELEKLRAEVEALKAEKARAGERGYSPPTFPEVIVRALPVVERPAHLNQPDAETDEATTPEVPWFMQETQETEENPPIS